MLTERQWFNLLTSLLLFAVGIVGSYFPKLCFGGKKCMSKTAKLMFRLGNMLSAGAMLGASLCDIMPDAVESLHSTRFAKGYPLVFFLAGLGYIVTLAMDAIAQAIWPHEHPELPEESEECKESEECTEPLLIAEEGCCSSDQAALEKAAAMEKEAALLGEAHPQQEEEHRIPFVTAVILTVALSWHSSLAGGAIGSQTDVTAAEHILFAVLGHKGLEAYALGASLVASKADGKRFWLAVLTYASAMPFGIAIGYGLSAAVSGVVAVLLSSMASGTFIYVAANEIIPMEMKDTSHVGKKLVALLGGFILMAAMPLIMK